MRNSEVRDDTFHEGLGYCRGGVITRGDQDSITGEAIDEDDEKLHPLVAGEGPHDVDG